MDFGKRKIGNHLVPNFLIDILNNFCYIHCIEQVKELQMHEPIINKVIFPLKFQGETDGRYKIVQKTFHMNDTIYQIYVEGEYKGLFASYKNALLELQKFQRENYYKTWELY